MMRTFVRSIAVLAVTAGLVAACGAAAAPTQAPTSALAAATTAPAPPDPTASPVVTPTAAPSVGPMDPAYVTGNASGGTETSKGTTREDGALTVVEGVVLGSISVTLSDARVTGSCTIHLNAVGSTADGVGFQWGTMRIENAGGAWEGPWSGAYWGGLQSETGMAGWMIGSGAYEGLTVYLDIRGHAGPPADLVGVILPAEPPTGTP
jgi:hypothetical protein